VNESFERHPTGFCCCFQGCIECLRVLRPFGEVSADDHVRVSTKGVVLRLYDDSVFRNLGYLCSDRVVARDRLRSYGNCPRQPRNIHNVIYNSCVNAILLPIESLIFALPMIVPGNARGGGYGLRACAASEP
jgi:hypothetical protein